YIRLTTTQCNSVQLRQKPIRNQQVVSSSLTVGSMNYFFHQFLRLLPPANPVARSRKEFL
ncbi:MAG TPA: hypothetical protein VND66_12880, partial [Acidobacteriaceae bacterium]|nr:hypothetical protein [Acidobacteriaceae bacterium]